MYIVLFTFEDFSRVKTARALDRDRILITDTLYAIHFSQIKKKSFFYFRKKDP